MIVHVLGYGVDHSLAPDIAGQEAGILHRASGVRRFIFGLMDGSTVDVSGADLEEWVRLYSSVGTGATARWTSSPIGPQSEAEQDDRAS